MIKKEIQDDFTERTTAALIRASKKAKELAARTGTPFVVMRNGKLTCDIPTLEEVGLTSEPAKHFAYFTVRPETVPLQEDISGTMKINGTEITLDAVLHEYKRGSSPESIVSMHGALKLADVHYIISFYLKNQADVDKYLTRNEGTQV